MYWEINFWPTVSVIDFWPTVSVIEHSTIQMINWSQFLIFIYTSKNCLLQFIICIVLCSIKKLLILQAIMGGRELLPLYFSVLTCKINVKIMGHPKHLFIVHVYRIKNMIVLQTSAFIVYIHNIGYPKLSVYTQIWHWTSCDKYCRISKMWLFCKFLVNMWTVLSQNLAVPTASIPLFMFMIVVRL